MNVPVRSAEFYSAVPPSCTRQAVRHLLRIATLEVLAECNSAVQQSETLRYIHRQRGFHALSTFLPKDVWIRRSMFRSCSDGPIDFAGKRVACEFECVPLFRERYFVQLIVRGQAHESFGVRGILDERDEFEL